MSHSETRICTN